MQIQKPCTSHRVLRFSSCAPKSRGSFRTDAWRMKRLRALRWPNPHANISRKMKIAIPIILGLLPLLQAQSQEVCKVTQPTATFAIHHQPGSPELSVDPNSPVWASAARANILKDCTHVIDYPELNSTVRGFWTDKDIYLLFECP